MFRYVPFARDVDTVTLLEGGDRSDSNVSTPSTKPNDCVKALAMTVAVIRDECYLPDGDTAMLRSRDDRAEEFASGGDRHADPTIATSGLSVITMHLHPCRAAYRNVPVGRDQ